MIAVMRDPTNHNFTNTAPPRPFAAHHRKAAFALASNIRYLITRYAPRRIYALTLNSADATGDCRTAQHRFKSLQTHSLAFQFQEWVVVTDICFHPIQFHLLAVVAATCAQSVKQLSQHLRPQLATYDFHLRSISAVPQHAPIAQTFVRRYLAAVTRRHQDQKRARIIRYSQGWRPVTAQFAWHSAGAWLWRAKLARFAAALGARRLENLPKLCGKRWAYHFGELIMAIELTDYPTLEHAHKDGWEPATESDATARTIIVNNIPRKMKRLPNSHTPVPAHTVAQVILRNCRK
jgi:hypothetical protein